MRWLKKYMTVLAALCGIALGVLGTIVVYQWYPGLNDNWTIHQQRQHYQHAVAMGGITKPADNDGFDQTLNDLNKGQTLKVVSSKLSKFGPITGINQRVYSGGNVEKQFYNQFGTFDYIFFTRENGINYATTLQRKDQTDINQAARNKAQDAIYSSGKSDADRNAALVKINVQYPVKLMFRYTYVVYQE